MHRATLTIAFAASLFALASPAGAQTDPANPPAVAAAHAYDPNAVECRSVPIFGSRTRTQKCLTRRDWNQLHADGRAFVEGIQRGGSYGSNFGR